MKLSKGLKIFSVILECSFIGSIILYIYNYFMATKKYEIILSDEVKSKLYDIGYIMGYNDYFKYYKNNY